MCAPPWRGGAAGGYVVPFYYFLEEREEGRTVETDLRAPAQCVHHPRNRHVNESCITLSNPLTQKQKHLNHIKYESKRKTTLMPLRETNASWPGLRAITSPSTNRLTGRLTNWSSRYVQCKDQDGEEGVYKSGYREEAHLIGWPPLPSKWSNKIMYKRVSKCQLCKCFQVFHSNLFMVA